MWGLQFIMIMVVVDFGDDNADDVGSLTSLILAGSLTVVFLVVAAKDWMKEARLEQRGASEWNQVREWYDHNKLNQEGYDEIRDRVESASKDIDAATTSGGQEVGNKAAKTGDGVAIPNPIYQDHSD